MTTGDISSEMLEAERDVQNRLQGRPLDFEADRAIANIYRAAASIRRRGEQGELAEYGLSWGGFTILWVLWVWGEMPTARLATECDLAKGTLTGMINTLQKRGLVSRRPAPDDKRRVLVKSTKAGMDIIEELFPRINGFEVSLLRGLSRQEVLTLSRLLRVVIHNAG